MAVGDVVQVNILGTLVGQLIEYVLHFRAKNGTATIPGLVTDLQAGALKDLVTQGKSDGLVFAQLKLTSLVPYGTAPAFVTLSPNWPGLSAGDPLPPQCAQVVTKYTGLIGRRRRGRLYLAGGREADQAGGVWAAGNVTAVQGYADALLAVFGTGGSSNWQLAVWSRVVAGAAPPFNATAAEIVQSLLVRNLVETQRRRAIGRGA